MTTAESEQRQPERAGRFRFLFVFAFLPFLLHALVPAPPFYNELRAISILLNLSGKYAPLLSGFATNPVTEEVIRYPGQLGPTRARLFHPVGIAQPEALVVVHGLQYLGMNDPRLEKFAHTLAAHGYLVMTPQVDELADFRITKNSAVVIGDAVHELVRRSGQAKVGLLGLSFAGGMSLIAASDPEVARQLSVVISIGGYDDLRRVLEFYETDRTSAPDGEVLRMKANDYGVMVMAYGYASAFFAPDDVARARRALLAKLKEKPELAYAEAAELSPAGQTRMKQIFDDDAPALVPEIERSLDAVQPELEAASPYFYISHMRVPVLLLHGSTDDVVPPTEMLWLKHDLPPKVVKGALISSAVGHVDLESVSWTERWRLVEWIRKMLGLLDAAQPKQSGSSS